MPTTMPTGGSSCARKASAPCGSAWLARSRAARPRSDRAPATTRRPGQAGARPSPAGCPLARKAISTFVTGLPRPVAAAFSAAAGASVGAGSGRNSTAAASAAATVARKQRGREAQDRAGTFRRPAPRWRAGGPPRRASSAPVRPLADRRLGQRHVDGIEAHPDQCKQQSVGDEANDRCEGFARGDRPARNPQHKHRQGRHRTASAVVMVAAARVAPRAQ